jgi:hypothetical protein
LLAIAADAVFRHTKGLPLIQDRRYRAECGAQQLTNASSGYSTIFARKGAAKGAWTVTGFKKPRFACE